MRQSLQLRLGQQLTMTPQLQQAIRLLQLSSLDLQVEIQAALDSNLMLERADEAPEEHAETDPAPNVEENLSPENELNTNSEALPNELPVDSAWEDVYESYDGTTSFSRSEETQRDPFEHYSSGGESLHDLLNWQMQLTPFSETDATIAAALIDGIDEAGYLSVPVEDIFHDLADEIDIELDEVEAVLHQIQNFDPPGVAARDLSECLMLQLNQMPQDTPWLQQAKNLIENHLDFLASRDFNGLIRRMRISRDELQQVMALIQSLNPRPGTQLSNSQAQYIVPDVFVYQHKNTWRVELNPDNAPRLRINTHYAALVRRADNSEDNTYLRNHLQEARWFLKSLKNRNETLLRVATSIVERQRDFLEHGEESMKPLILRDIAESMDMHESTISRVTTQKYMHTPRGIYEFKYFFSSHVGTKEGGECSSIAIRAMIKKLINLENPEKPLSDSKIAQLLGKEGIQVARRTVAKYREGMSIPSSTERKQLA